MKKLILLLTLFIVTGNVFAQFPHPDTTYFFLFGNNGVDEFRDVCNDARDSGYVAVGTSSSFSNGNSDVYLVKTDWKGNTLWSRSIGSPGIENGYSIEQTFDSGFIIAGFTNNTAGGDYDAMLIKTDSSGFVEWQKNFGGSDWDFAYAVSLAPDSGFVFCGETYSFGNLSSDVYIVRTDKNGNLLWEKNYGGTGKEKASNLTPIYDTSFIVCGYTDSYGAGMKDAWILNINLADGDTVYTKTFGGAMDDEFVDVIRHSIDSGFVGIGYSYSFDPQSSQLYLLKTDRYGTQLWYQNFGITSSNLLGRSLAETPNAEIWCMGETPLGGGKKDVWNFITDQAGIGYWSLYSCTFGKAEDDFGYESILTKRNDYLIAGSSKSFNDLNGDAVLYLTDSILLQGYKQDTYFSSDTLVGIYSKENNIVSIFPNPVTDKIYISNHNDQQGEVSQISVTSINGETLLCEHRPADAKLLVIDVAFLPSGLYILAIQSRNDVKFFRFIKQ